ncbi:hypothetical protein CONPUDRAFT_157187 [Coniophora puteana RWD-64-598 SS2]|uniref:Homeobox domain-containing protein n=1 Tax=Coniophora puteana (strain RWD-64-598) TaxID=741705 RepID=A0A5M3MGG2_CONPW|nr:uncharacterized protein CONPUDRAFT_157187 [Coniophora puteana RWD-64-598 SS2]EIW78020.1 hypothetical protein CONPUDRAFT_157187 [Coniophora puteana RWD-64-598 SS2]
MSSPSSPQRTNSPKRAPSPSPSTQPQSSRRIEHENSPATHHEPSPHPSSYTATHARVPLTIHSADLHSEPTTFGQPSTSSRPRPPDDELSPRPSKKMRADLHSPEERVSSSQSDTSSQSGMADVETEPEKGQQSEPSNAPAAPAPKKKRTRTLTTPHQSAVLHALLAQSRFPTTAMREQVGRQIGLSARKVQIWFQNQRQKARRPQGDKSAPLSRPPQYGPFSNTPVATPSAGIMSMGPLGPMSHIASFTSSDSMRPLGAETSPLGPELSGPGIPGFHRPGYVSSGSSRELDPQTFMRGTKSPEVPRQRAARMTDESRILPELSHTQGGRPLAPRPLTAPGDDPRSQSARVLPPLNFGASTPPRRPANYVSPTLYHQTTTSSSGAGPGPASTSSGPRSAGPEPSSAPATASSMPPPFALQPQPQWDPHTFAPYTPPQFSWTESSRRRPSVRWSYSAVVGSPRSSSAYVSSSTPHSPNHPHPYPRRPREGSEDEGQERR